MGMLERNGRVVAVANMKGGVGKTTTAVMLAEGFAEVGMTVLVVDLDAQANVSFCFLVNDQLKAAYEQQKTISAFLDERLMHGIKVPILEYISKDVSNVAKAGRLLPIDLLAAHPKLRSLEREILFELAGKGYGPKALEGRTLMVLQEALPKLRAHYDLVLLDCAPGISAFTEVAIRLSDLVVVPTIPDYLSTLGFEVFRHSLWDDTYHAATSLPKPKRLPAVLATRVNLTKKQHKWTLDDMRAEAAEAGATFTMFDVMMSNQAAIERAMDPEQFPDPPTFVQKWGTAVPLVRDLMDETWRRLND
ncbi:ParA family protein [Xanthobacter sp. ZOL 2024]